METKDKTVQISDDVMQGLHELLLKGIGMVIHGKDTPLSPAEFVSVWMGICFLAETVAQQGSYSEYQEFMWQQEIREMNERRRYNREQGS